MNIDVVININKAYMQYAQVMLKSLFDNNGQLHVTLHWLYASVDEADIRFMEAFIGSHNGILKTYQVDIRVFEGFLADRRWSVETYFRLLIPEMLPCDLERVLYLDADLIINGDISGFYKTDFQNHCMVVCENLDPAVNVGEKNRIWNRDGKEMYFNAGVMLLNLDKLREKSSIRQYQLLMEHSPQLFPMLDQDLLNYCFGKDVLYEDAHRYNYIVSRDTEIDNHAVIYHFATKEKPWMQREETVYSNLWWGYADKLEKERD